MEQDILFSIKKEIFLEHLPHHINLPINIYNIIKYNDDDDIYIEDAGKAKQKTFSAKPCYSKQYFV